LLDQALLVNVQKKSNRQTSRQTGIIKRHKIVENNKQNNIFLFIFSSSSQDGGRPKVEYSTDSTYKAREVGPSGIPHTSYSQSGSSYSTENPYKNRVSSFSYNI
jgi:hypothetical protein